MSAPIDATTPAGTRPRYLLIDIARGVAIIAMIVYHGAWDLWFYQFIATEVPFHPGWVTFQRAILTTFLALVGFGLVIGHGDGVRWPSFWKRFALIAGGALLVTVATWFFSPDSFVYFGILHAIAAFSLIGVLLVRAPIALTATIGLLSLVLPLFIANQIFSLKPMSWIGLWTEPPYTDDLVPVFPWLGVVILALTVTRLARSAGLLPRLAAIAPTDPVSRALAWMGRWSLPIYLIHQPVLLAVILPLALWLQPETAMRADQFSSSCVATCQSSAGDTAGAFCTTYCQCVLTRVQADDLWSILENPATQTPAQSTTILDLTNQCAAIGIEGASD